MDEIVERTDEAAPGGEGALESDSRNIGPRVGAVFTAAEKAAQHIMAIAREEADDLRRQAQAEAESYLEERRKAADEEAQKVLVEAEAEAHAIRHAARESARRIEEDARKEADRAREEIDLLRERADWAREGLREAVSRLEVELPPTRSA